MSTDSDFRQQEGLPLLLCKYLAGELTDEERVKLEAWRKESQANERVFRHLTDSSWLNKQLNIRRMIDYRRPLADAKARLLPVRHGGLWRQPARWAAAAAVAAVVITVAALTLWDKPADDAATPEQPSMAQTLIAPGHVQATLTLPSGATQSLTASDAGKPLATRSACRPPEAQATEPEEAPRVLATPRGGEFCVVLEDGSEVWLNADTRLTYPEAFHGQERRVELSGEAYFKVANDPDRPFYVVSGGQEVRVYGTEFNIHAYQDEPLIQTTLVEGSISLRPINAGQRELMLTPGHQAVYDKDKATASLHTVDTEIVTSWRTGAFVFEDQTLEQIMHTLSRWYDFDYEFSDEQTASTVFMGSIPRYGTFSEVCDIFHKIGGIQLRQQGRKVYIATVK